MKLWAHFVFTGAIGVLSPSWFAFGDWTPSTTVVIDAEFTNRLATAREMEFHNSVGHAHRLRLTAYWDAMTQSPQFNEFMDKHPEVRTIVAQREKILNTIIEHDWEKNFPGFRTKEFTQTLAKADAHGIDWRSLSADNPFRQKMIVAIKELNEIGKPHWDQVLSKWSEGERKLVDWIVEALDKYDVPFGRNEDFGAGTDRFKRGNLQSGKEWIANSAKNGLKYSPEQIEFMTSMMDHMEKYVDAPAIAANYAPKTMTTNFRTRFMDIVHGTDKKVVHAPVLKKPKIKTPAVSAVGIIGVVATAAVKAAEVVYDPQQNLNGDIIPELISFSEVPKECDSLSCRQWRQECENKKLSDSDCIRFFFTLPLSEQSRLRADGAVDRILQNYSPRIENMTCPKDLKTGQTTAKIQMYDARVGFVEQAIEYDYQGRTQRVTTRSLRDLSDRKHILMYNTREQATSFNAYDFKNSQYVSFEKDEFVEHVTHAISQRSKDINLALDTASASVRLQQATGRAIKSCCAKRECTEKLAEYAAKLGPSRMTFTQPIRVAE